MPLDSAEPWVDVMHSGRPTWILANGDKSAAAFLDRLKCKTDILALPLFGGHASPKMHKGEFPPEPSGDEDYWTIKARRLGALYIATNRRAVSPTTLKFLQRLADRIGVTTAGIMQHERVAANVAKLQRERQWVESIMKSVADPIVLTNLDNEILLQNQRAEELFSGSEEASEGKRRALKMNDLLFSAYLSSAAVSSTEIIGRDLTLVDPIGGSDIHFEVISTPAVNAQGERIGLVSVFRDVTDLRRANEELARWSSPTPTAISSCSIAARNRSFNRNRYRRAQRTYCCNKLMPPRRGRWRRCAPIPSSSRRLFPASPRKPAAGDRQRSS